MTNPTPRGLARWAFICTILVLALPAAAQDSDGDGMSDALEQVLATDPEFPEELEPIAESQPNGNLTGADARYDLTRVRFGNVAQGRWLWALEFAAP